MKLKPLLVSINAGNFGSTGKIMRQISKKAESFGYETIQVYAGNTNNLPAISSDFIISSEFVRKINQRFAMYTGYNGCFAYFSTKRLISFLKKKKPDILHLHNLHNSYINIPLLFKFIKKHNIRVVWTLHDCWAFTGCCPHFTFVKCDKWKTLCNNCLQYKCYPKSSFDNSKMMYNLKKKWFNGANITLVTPSEWLKNLVEQSFLGNYPVQVINNGIDLSVFKPTKSDFRERYRIDNDKFIVLGVAFGWGERKGLDVMIELSKRLPEKYQIVLVGTSDLIDKQLPKNIISIHRTQNQNELAEIYSAADLFVNPTREEVFGLVNVESLACGTPVLTFDTGGSSECIDGNCGMVVSKSSLESMTENILQICENKLFSQLDCVNRAGVFSMAEMYISLYQELLSGKESLC